MERLAQLVIVPVVQAQFRVVDEFPASERGERRLRLDRPFVKMAGRQGRSVARVSACRHNPRL